jgi:hypothetical protein
MKGTLRHELVEYSSAIAQRMLGLVPAISQHTELSALVHSRSIATTNINGYADTRRTFIERVFGLTELPECFVLVTMPFKVNTPVNAVDDDFDNVVSNIRHFSTHERFRFHAVAS